MRPLICTVLALCLAAPSVALAGKPKQQKKRDNSVTVTLRFGSHQREVTREYFVSAHGRGNCPPGLAKKNNGCLPPGHAKKRYVVGSPMPDGVFVEDPPPDLAIRVGPPPKGYRYGIVDGDLVKLAIGTALVVDAIEGLVN